MADYGGGMVTGHYLYVAIYDFQAETEAELSFKEGDVLEVYTKDGEWWEGANQEGKVGLFPANRVEEYHGDAQQQEQQEHAQKYSYDEVKYAEGPVAHTGQVQINWQQQQQQQQQQQTQAVYGGGHAIPQMQQQQQFQQAPKPAPRPAKGGGGGGGGGGKGGGNKAGGDFSVGQNKTKFGPWASNMAKICAFFDIALGMASMIWGAKDEDTYGLTYVMIGMYAMVLGVATWAWEIKFGVFKLADGMQTRAIAYFMLSFPLYFSVPTAFVAAFYLPVVVANAASTHVNEEYAPRAKRASKKKKVLQHPEAMDLPIQDRFVNWVLLKKEQNELGTIVWLSLYYSACTIIFFTALATWVEKNNNFPPGQQLSGWAPLAKAFGNFLDFNCAIIVLPVCRTVIRFLYDVSTSDEGIIARGLRAVLAFVPLDHAIEFHKLVAYACAFGAIGHTVMHLFNYINAPSVTLSKFGVWPWVSGGIIFMCMVMMYAAVEDTVKRGQFEIFWYSHHCFILYFFFLLLHGNGGFNPNFWKWFLLPGTIYIIERCLRIYRANKEVVVLSVTHMKPKVFSLEFDKVGIFAKPYSEGQYLFIACPHVSPYQWHPFTISSAPQEKSVTLHIQIQGPGSWTRQVNEYLASMGAKGATYHEFSRQDGAKIVRGKITGPDGLPLFQIDGPHSAPTQHISEYHTCMIAGAGIGVTPVASTLKSVVMHRWKYYMGHCYPDNAYFAWVCSHRDVESFRWLVRTIKECEDELFDMRAKNPKDMQQKRFEFHIWITSVPKDQKPMDVVVDDDIGFWGVPQEDRNIDKVRAPFDEEDLYKAMKCPSEHVQMGDVHVRKGRPKWQPFFAKLASAHPKGEIGVCFCGNPFIGAALQENCHKFSSLESERIFKLHKENF